MIKPLILFSIIFFSACHFANGQVISLDSILLQIEQRNPQLQVFNSQIKAKDAYAEEARAWEAPRVGGGLWQTPYNLKPGKNAGNAGSEKMGSSAAVMLSAEQMIPNPQKLKAKENYMRVASSVDKERKNEARNILFAEAKIHYYEWAVLKKKETVLRQNENLLKFMIKASELRLTYNQEKLHNIYKAKADLAELQNRQIALQNEIRKKNIAINTLLNQDQQVRFEVDTTIVLKALDQTILDSTALALRRSDVRAINESIRLLQLKRDVAASDRRPEYGVRFDHMQMLNGAPSQFTALAMVSIPFVPWAARGYKPNIKGISYEMQTLKWEKQALINTIKGNIAAMQAEYSSQKQQLDLYKSTIIPALKNNYNTALLAYQQNTESLFVVLDALQGLQLTQLEYLTKFQELLLLQVGYEKEVEQQ
jgi:cobalt-zinc-cadmium efflux system outer membrane protein